MKTYAVVAKKAGPGKCVLHVYLKGGAKGAGKTYAWHTCMNNPRDYAVCVGELLSFARKNHGIEAWNVLNRGPFPLPYQG